MQYSLDKIYSLGDDHLVNRFEVAFPEGIPGSKQVYSEQISLRIDQAVDIPSKVVGEYEYYHRGLKIVQPSTVEETDKHLTLQVRIDGNLSVYNALWAWRKMVWDENSASSAYDITGVTRKGLFYAPVIINLYGSNDSKQEKKASYTFHNCALKELQITSLDPASNDPLRATLNLIWGEISFETSTGSPGAEQDAFLKLRRGLVGSTRFVKAT